MGGGGGRLTRYRLLHGLAPFWSVGDARWGPVPGCLGWKYIEKMIDCQNGGRRLGLWKNL